MNRNAFHELDANEKLPPKVKEETLSHVRALGFVMDIVDQFVSRSGQSIFNSFPPSRGRPLGLDQYPASEDIQPGESQ